MVLTCKLGVVCELPKSKFVINCNVSRFRGAASWDSWQKFFFNFYDTELHIFVISVFCVPCIFWAGCCDLVGKKLRSTSTSA